MTVSTLYNQNSSAFINKFLKLDEQLILMISIVVEHGLLRVWKNDQLITLSHTGNWEVLHSFIIKVFIT